MCINIIFTYLLPFFYNSLHVNLFGPIVSTNKFENQQLFIRVTVRFPSKAFFFKIIQSQTLKNTIKCYELLLRFEFEKGYSQHVTLFTILCLHCLLNGFTSLINTVELCAEKFCHLCVLFIENYLW